MDRTLSSFLGYLRVLAVILVAISCRIAYSQQLSHFKTLTIENGLSDNTVKAVTEDRQGFIWIGTFNGLCRYDGHELKIFRNEASDTNSIINNHVEALQPMEDGLLIGTLKGLCFYSSKTGQFHTAYMSVSKLPVNEYIKSILKVGNNIFVLTASKKLLQMMPDHSFQVSPLYSGEVNGIANVKNKLLLSTKSGLEIINPVDGSLISSMAILYRETADKHLFFDSKTGILYVGNGIGYESEAYNIGKELQLTKADIKLPRNVKAVVRLDDKLLFGTDGEGLTVQSDSSEYTITQTNSALTGNAVHSLFVDRDSNVWIGTYRGGLNIHSKRYSWFDYIFPPTGALSKVVSAVLPYKNELYLGLDGGGLWRYNPQTKSSRLYTTSNSSIPVNNVLCILPDNDCLWIALYNGGVAKFRPNDNSFQLFKLPSRENGEENNRIWRIVDDGHGHLFVLCKDLYIFDKETHNFSDVQHLKGTYPSGVLFRGDTVWVSSSQKGLYCIRKHDNKILKHINGFNIDGRVYRDIRYMTSDKSGRIWLGTEDNGLVTYQPATGIIKSLSFLQGAPNGNVTGIIEDHSGNYWISSTTGLYCYNPVEEIFSRFGSEDKVPFSQYNYYSCYAADSLVYFGAVGGVLSFNPELIEMGQRGNSVFFSQVNILDGFNTHIPLNTNTPNEIRLKYNQNFFTVGFSVPEPITSEKLTYSAYLEGFDKEWQLLGNTHEVTYTNVPPGKYILHIKATNAFQSSKDIEGTISIEILPPWWLTWWAISLWVILSVGIIVLVFYRYQRELKIQQKAALTEMERNATKTISEAKLNFFTNVTHELRTPIFLLTANLEEIIKGGKNTLYMPKTYVAAMYRNALRLNKIVSRIIDFRKLESGKLKLNLYRQNVVAFCKTLTGDYESLCGQKDILFSFQPSKNIILMDFDPEKLETIISNLVSNAFKYTNEGGRVTFSITETDGNVEFCVADTGIGIKKEYHEAIFDKFFQIDPTKSPTMSDGIGLSFVRHLVELHGGTINVESKPDKGSRFTIVMPALHSDEKDSEHVDEPGSEPVQTDVSGVNDSIVENLSLAPQVVVSSPASTKTILIIDDEKETVELLERALISDFNVIKAFDGMSGYSLLQDKLPDIVICDVMMPKLDGISFLKMVRKDKVRHNIPVIMFTAKTSEESQIEAFEAGADAYLTKPISISLLRKRIESLLKRTESVGIVNEIANSDKKYSKEEQLFLLKCREVIDNNLTNDNFNVELLATELGMSHSSLYRRIKDVTDMSIVEFINDYRIFRAVRYIREGERNVTAVSVRCGFNDLKNFRELFKRKTGMTPRQFISQL